MRIQGWRSLGAAVMACGFAGLSMAAEIAGTQRIVAQLQSGDPQDHIRASRALFDFSGITDPQIFDLIAARLEAGDKSSHGSHQQTDEMAWYVKALASSGDPRYLPMLKSLAAGQTPTVAAGVQRHAEKAVALLPQFTRWNPIINSRDGAEAGDSPEIVRARNMLRSGEPALQRGALSTVKAARRVHPELYDLVEVELRKIDVKAAEAAADVTVLDTAGWLCRSLGESGNRKYEALLRDLYANAETHKLKKGCKKGWEVLQRGGLKDGAAADQDQDDGPSADAS